MCSKAAAAPPYNKMYTLQYHYVPRAWHFERGARLTGLNFHAPHYNGAGESAQKAPLGANSSNLKALVLRRHECRF